MSTDVPQAACPQRWIAPCGYRERWAAVGGIRRPVPPDGRSEGQVPVYEYRCQACGSVVDRLLPHDRADAPGPCSSCGGDLRRRFSRVAVRLDGWGFSRTDGWVPERPGRGEFREVRERAERLSDGD